MKRERPCRDFVKADSAILCSFERPGPTGLEKSVPPGRDPGTPLYLREIRSRVEPGKQ
jgi:hypothetical protein